MANYYRMNILLLLLVIISCIGRLASAQQCGSWSFTWINGTECWGLKEAPATSPEECQQVFSVIILLKTREEEEEEDNKLKKPPSLR